MEWGGIAWIVVICTSMNHMGLVAAAERTLRRPLPVVNCTKCLTCWSVFGYQLAEGCSPLPSLAVSFLAAYAAVWLELLMGIIDTLYNRIYEEIYEDTDEGSERRGA